MTTLTIRQTIITGLTFLLLSCGQRTDTAEIETKTSVNKTSTQDTVDKKKTTRLTVSKPKNQNNKVKRKSIHYQLTLQFDSVAILLEAPHDYLPKISRLNNDSAYLFIDYTGRITELQLAVMPRIPFDSIVIEQKFENALTLSNQEGGFVHLKNWWQIDASWTKLPFIRKKRTFKIKSYDRQENRKIFRASFKDKFDEIKTEALKHKADDYYGPLIKKATTIDRLPLDIWASKYIIRITIITGSRNIEKYIIMQEMYGC